MDNKIFSQKDMYDALSYKIKLCREMITKNKCSHGIYCHFAHNIDESNFNIALTDKMNKFILSKKLEKEKEIYFQNYEKNNVINLLQNELDNKKIEYEMVINYLEEEKKKLNAKVLKLEKEYDDSKKFITKLYVSNTKMYSELEKIEKEKKNYKFKNKLMDYKKSIEKKRVNNLIVKRKVSKQDLDDELDNMKK